MALRREGGLTRRPGHLELLLRALERLGRLLGLEFRQLELLAQARRLAAQFRHLGCELAFF